MATFETAAGLRQEIGSVIDRFLSRGDKEAEGLVLAVLLETTMEKMYLICGGDFDLMRSRLRQSVDATEQILAGKQPERPR